MATNAADIALTEFSPTRAVAGVPAGLELGRIADERAFDETESAASFEDAAAVVVTRGIRIRCQAVDGDETSSTTTATSTA